MGATIRYVAGGKTGYSSTKSTLDYQVGYSPPSAEGCLPCEARLGLSLLINFDDDWVAAACDLIESGNSCIVFGTILTKFLRRLIDN